MVFINCFKQIRNRKGKVLSYFYFTVGIARHSTFLNIQRGMRCALRIEGASRRWAQFFHNCGALSERVLRKFTIKLINFISYCCLIVFNDCSFPFLSSPNDCKDDTELIFIIYTYVVFVLKRMMQLLLNVRAVILLFICLVGHYGQKPQILGFLTFLGVITAFF